jgi:membrane-associated protease RseP (regulator of RpoE activity)
VPGVSEGGPAERAGLKPDDVILAIDGQSVTGVGVLRSLISTIQPGEEVAIDVWRDGERLTVRPVLDEAPPALTIGRSIETELGRFGLAIRVERDEEGEPAAYVRGVFRGAPAAEAGFEIGQRIVSVAGQPVRGSEDLINALERAGLLLGARGAGGRGEPGPRRRNARTRHVRNPHPPLTVDPHRSSTTRSRTRTGVPIGGTASFRASHCGVCTPESGCSGVVHAIVSLRKCAGR